MNDEHVYTPDSNSPASSGSALAASSSTVNRRIVLASRPKGAPTASDFRMEEHPIPAPGDGEVLLRTIFLSLDPYMRGRMSDAPSYAPPLELGAAMPGGTVSRIVESRHPGFKTGDLVQAFSGWQDYAISNGADVRQLDRTLPHPSYALGVLGMPGFTAYTGLLEIGTPRPGETVVVAAATGPVGSTVGQIAKIKGCRVVGIAGGPDKCEYARRELRFDACVDHKAPDFAQALAELCPSGIDVYFENVGGVVFDTVWPLLNTFARVPVCGLVARYNATSLPEGPDRVPLLLGNILAKRIRMQGFIIGDSNSDSSGHFAAFQRDMGQWVRQGRVKSREDIVMGLENAPEALIGLLEGRNFGKLVVKVGE